MKTTPVVITAIKEDILDSIGEVLAKAGSVIIPNENNPEQGYVRVEQTLTEINDQGFLNESRRSALVKGPIEMLKNQGWKEGQRLPGRIVVRESFTPFYEKQTEKINPETGNPVTKDGALIYREAQYDFTGNRTDEMISHDRVPSNGTDQQSQGQEQEEEDMSIAQQD